MFQQILAIFLVLGLLLAALWFLRKKGLAVASSFSMRGWVRSVRVSRTSPARRLRIVERLALTPQHSIHLVLVDEQRVLIATSPSGCQVVAATESLQGGTSLAQAVDRSAAVC